ncbi:MAG: alpha/beta hydrolase [Rudaea sp.]
MVNFSPLAATPSHGSAPRSARIAARDGVVLALDHFGPASAPAVVFAHGFGQTRHAWDESAAPLADAGWHCVTADARGHGESGWLADGNYAYDQLIDDLTLVARGCACGDVLPVLVGASMGGLLGLSAQALHAPLFRALVLVDITPRWEAAGVARILGFMRAHPQGFATFEEAADAIASYLPHRAERKSPGQLRKLLVAGADGRLRWHWDPRLLELVERDSASYQRDLLDAARSVAVPTLLVSGARSDVVSAATISEFLELVPHARHVRIEQATHMVAGDANTAFARAVAEFIEQLPLPSAALSARGSP